MVRCVGLYGGENSMRKKTLSVILATHNEAVRIARCLEAVKPIADEILIADGESTDATVEIAASYGARVLSVQNVPMFHENKVLAAKHATGDWILYLDADEIISEALRQEISTVLQGDHPALHRKSSNLSWIPAKKRRLFQKHMQAIALRDSLEFGTDDPPVAFFIPRKNYFLGAYLLHSGVYPDGVIRLVMREKGVWPCRDVHETMRVNGGVSWLMSPLLHEADPTFSRYLQRAARYTALTAATLPAAPELFRPKDFILYVFWKPATTWLLLFFRHKGFLDGFPGFIWALLSAAHFPLAYFSRLVSDTQRNFFNRTS